MSYLCDLFFNFSLTFIVINHITSLKQTHFFCTFLGYLLLFLNDNLDEESEQLSSSKSSTSGRCSAFACFFCQFQFGAAYVKKRVFVFKKFLLLLFIMP